MWCISDRASEQLELLKACVSFDTLQVSFDNLKVSFDTL
jgi:hypothetical protein